MMKSIPLSKKEEITLATLYEAGATFKEIHASLPGKSRGQINGRITHLGLHRPLNPDNVTGLKADNASVLKGQSIFQGKVRRPDKRLLLMAGYHQRKLGARVTKGRLKGFYIYSLTLEERKTCPSTCHHWLSCYGNGMHFAWRNKHGSELETALEAALSYLQLKHPRGFLVRLHVLGDFYSVEYVMKWKNWLGKFPALNIFGYTAWPKTTPIGETLAELADTAWERFSLRWSDYSPQPGGAVTLWQYPPLGALKKGTIICPVQTGKTLSCGTCGLCWSLSAKDKTIAFVAHGK